MSISVYQYPVWKGKGQKRPENHNVDWAGIKEVFYQIVAVEMSSIVDSMESGCPYMTLAFTIIAHQIQLVNVSTTLMLVHCSGIGLVETLH